MFLDLTSAAAGESHSSESWHPAVRKKSLQNIWGLKLEVGEVAVKGSCRDFRGSVIINGLVYHPSLS
jgi:hypothetical protein